MTFKLTATIALTADSPVEAEAMRVLAGVLREDARGARLAGPEGDEGEEMMDMVAAHALLLAVALEAAAGPDAGGSGG